MHVTYTLCHTRCTSQCVICKRIEYWIVCSMRDHAENLSQQSMSISLFSIDAVLLLYCFPPLLLTFMPPKRQNSIRSADIRVKLQISNLHDVAIVFRWVPPLFCGSFLVKSFNYPANFLKFISVTTCCFVWCSNCQWLWGTLRNHAQEERVVNSG